MNLHQISNILHVYFINKISESLNPLSVKILNILVFVIDFILFLQTKWLYVTEIILFF